MKIILKIGAVLAASTIILSVAGAQAKESDSEVFFMEKVLDEELAMTRGMALSPEVLGFAALEATATNNTSTGGMTGSNALSDSALGSARGVVSVVQNTGNNVVIQSATIVNLTLNN